MIPARQVWVIRALPSEGEFASEAEAIARAWELTEPGKDRWIVVQAEAQVMKDQRTRLLANDRTQYRLLGRIAGVEDLPESGQHVGDLIWIEEIGELAVLRQHPDGRDVWFPMDMGSLPFTIFEEIRERAGKEGWR